METERQRRRQVGGRRVWVFSAFFSFRILGKSREIKVAVERDRDRWVDTDVR